MTPIVFVPVDAGERKALCPELGNIDEGVRLHLAKHILADSDIGDVDLAAMETARQQQMTGLAAKEGDRFAGRDGGALDLSARAVDAARQIHRIDGRRRGIDRLDHGACAALHGPVKTRAKQRIDHHPGAGEAGRLRGLEWTAPAGGGGRRITLEAVCIADKEQAHRMAAFKQDTGGDKAVAAVVARACHYHHGHRRRMPGCDRIGDRTSSILHELDAAGSGSNGQPISLRHLGGGEQLDHGATTLPAQPECHNWQSFRCARRYGRSKIVDAQRLSFMITS